MRRGMLVRGASSWLIVGRRTVSVLTVAAATARGFTSRAARRRCVMSYDACAVVTGGRGRQSESRACTIIIR